MSAAKDERRDCFVTFHEVAESGASRFIPLHAVVILARADEFLLVLNRRKQAWELPGGLIDPGESPRDCAASTPFHLDCPHDGKAKTAEGDRLEVLAKLVDAHERTHFPMDLPDAVE